MTLDAMVVPSAHEIINSVHLFVASLSTAGVLASLMNISYALLALEVGIWNNLLLSLAIMMGFRSKQYHGLTAGKEKKELA